MFMSSFRFFIYSTLFSLSFTAKAQISDFETKIQPVCNGTSHIRFMDTFSETYYKASENLNCNSEHSLPYWAKKWVEYQRVLLEKKHIAQPKIQATEPIKTPNLTDQLKVKRKHIIKLRQVRSKNVLKEQKRLFSWVKSKKSLHSQYYAKEGLTTAKRIWTEDTSKSALKFINKELIHKCAPLCQETKWLKAKIQIQLNDTPTAIKTLNKAFKENPRTGIANLILWDLFLIHYKNSHLDLAKNALLQRIKNEKTPYSKAQSLYWLGKIQSLEQKTSTQNSTADTKTNQSDYWLELVHNSPLSYYASVASVLLGPQNSGYFEEKQKTSAKKSKPEPSFDYLKNLNKFKTIPQKDFQDFYMKYGIQISPELFASLRFDTLKTELFKSKKAFIPFIKPAFELNQKEWRVLPQHKKDLVFPRQYSKIIENNCTTDKYPIAFVYSIIRQESVFDPNAISPMKALGLMQVHSSAHSFAKSEESFDPELNIKKGCSLLSELSDKVLKEFPDVTPIKKLLLMASGYNASFHKTIEWGKLDIQEMDLWLEHISYSETQSYMKTVYRNLLYYRDQLTPVEKESPGL